MGRQRGRWVGKHFRITFVLILQQMAESKLAYVRTFYMTTTATHASHIQKEVEHGFIFGSGQAAGQQRPHGQEHG